jgi:hypothetical protein
VATAHLLSSWQNYNGSATGLSRIIAGTMLLHTCDKCGVKIDGPALDRKSLQVGIGSIYTVELCTTCAEPVVQFLTTANLLQAQLQQYGFITNTV